MNLAELLDYIYEPLEEKSRWQIDMARSAARTIKFLTPEAGTAISTAMREVLRLIERSALAGRIFDHYIAGRGATYTLTDRDVRELAGEATYLPLDIRRASFQDSRPRQEWLDTLAANRREPGRLVPYIGRTHWATENGAMANYTFLYEGAYGEFPISPQLQPACTVPMWQGFVRVYDRFDLDPRWTWSPANPGGRSAMGERQTRVGYILEAGTDFDITSPQIYAWQRPNDEATTVTTLDVSEYRLRLRDMARRMQPAR